MSYILELRYKFNHVIIREMFKTTGIVIWNYQQKNYLESLWQVLKCFSILLKN